MDALPPLDAIVPNIRLPDVPVLVASARGVVWLSPDGEVETLPHPVVREKLSNTAAIVCHMRAAARCLGMEAISAFDVLELFAFTRPAQFCTPTPTGIARALGLDVPTDPESTAVALLDSVTVLLGELAAAPYDQRLKAALVATAMGPSESQHRWPWQLYILNALNIPAEAITPARARAALEVWRQRPEWSEHAPPQPAGHKPVEPAEARQRLAAMVAAHVPGKASEPRPQQSDYASAVSTAFQPRVAEGVPHAVLAEAGTGVGKTLGYLAPATLWAEQNGGPVWVSTYTRNLQNQIDTELDRLYPDPALKTRKVVVRKGRENYLCLLNLEDVVRTIQIQPHNAVAAGLMVRWAEATRDGDLVGGDLPGWLPDLIGRVRTLGLADRRGECIHSACPHYTRCFVEHTVRRARRADIVIANHALVMSQAANGDYSDLSTRLVFDEGHHIFDAADSAFSAHLTGLETAELRRWFLGAEGSNRSRARGLKRRIEELVAGDDEASALLDAILEAARALPGESWQARVSGGLDMVRGPAERFLYHARAQVYARDGQADKPYGLETEVNPPLDELIEAAHVLEQALTRLSEPIGNLAKHMRRRLENEADTLETETRQRLESAARSLEWRGKRTVDNWRSMLQAVGHETPPEFVDWLSVERSEGRDIDVGLCRHGVDPTIPFAASVSDHAHGLVVTSATLTDVSGDVEADWASAATHTGMAHLPMPALRARVPSPFDYAAQTRVLVVTDLNRDDPGQMAAAYRELFKASGGGALGLFTAVQRLRAVHSRIVEPLEQAGLPLYAQHVDGLDVSTLIDIFREEEDACLLGTDAVRDGVDVPGRSLRLIVFDRVPWPRPAILHKARRSAFGGNAYDDRITRLRLRQAFGRLVRRADDKGVFVLLDRQFPTRLTTAFPEGVQVQRIGLADAIAMTREFLG